MEMVVVFYNSHLTCPISDTARPCCQRQSSYPRTVQLSVFLILRFKHVYDFVLVHRLSSLRLHRTHGLQVEHTSIRIKRV